MDHWVSLVYVAEDGTLCTQAFEGRLLAQGRAGDVYRRADDGKFVYFDKQSQKIHEAVTIQGLEGYLEGREFERLKKSLDGDTGS